MRLLFALLFLFSAPGHAGLWHDKDDQHWIMYPMMNANDSNQELGKNVSYHDNLVETVTEYCTWAKGELPVMIWGVRTFDSKTNHERVFDCAKHINPTN